MNGRSSPIPRVDTRFLPDDIYPKTEGILKKLGSLHPVVNDLLQKEIKKTKRTFDDSKVTDHHAIIPTGSMMRDDGSVEWKVFDLVSRAFIAQFCDDCRVENTTVKGHVNSVRFTAKGRVILEEGWRVLYPKETEHKKYADDDVQVLPVFTQGESGPHSPKLLEKETAPPKPYTEATLLRAMETAGKQVDDEDLRQLMKENGIGRPSTRANIIETLFKRRYIRRNKKSLLPTETGVELIGVIKNELLKSVELTGIWEGKLRKIEKGEFTKEGFLTEMTELVAALVDEVRSSDAGPIKMIARKRKGAKRNSSEDQSREGSLKNNKKKSGPSPAKSPAPEKSAGSAKGPVGQPCPLCGEGEVIRGRAAWGCSRFRNGCTFVLPFEHHGKKLTDTQAISLVTKKRSGRISGFNINGTRTSGVLIIKEDGRVELENEASENNEHRKSTSQKAEAKNEPHTSGMVCPKCGKGRIIKGRRAWGCSNYTTGCNFVIPFEKIEEAFGDHSLDQERLNRLIK